MDFTIDVFISLIMSLPNPFLSQSTGKDCGSPIVPRPCSINSIFPDGVAAVYDGVGKDTFVLSFECVKPFGALINYGNASGSVPYFPLVLLAQKGYLVLHRPGFCRHENTSESRQQAQCLIDDRVIAALMRQAKD